MLSMKLLRMQEEDTEEATHLSDLLSKEVLDLLGVIFLSLLQEVVIKLSNCRDS